MASTGKHEIKATSVNSESKGVNRRTQWTCRFIEIDEDLTREKQDRIVDLIAAMLVEQYQSQTSTDGKAVDSGIKDE